MYLGCHTVEFVCGLVWHAGWHRDHCAYHALLTMYACVAQMVCVSLLPISLLQTVCGVRHSRGWLVLVSLCPQGGSVVTDLHPYEVDGRAQVALLQVEPDSVEEEQGQEEEGDAAEQGGETDEGTTAYGYEQAQQQQMVQQEALRAY